ncbi:GMC oxidoreductase [Mycolicibacterium sp. P9-64]|uniref:GMC oxidoreductase n=1 Tax=Mycolicibacterium sp. P9-64 TaxID=2024612 RepID=UPI0011F050AB|nr:GMC oxidoreductase [Mycolicibacterium sp. P9-64]
MAPSVGEPPVNTDVVVVGSGAGGATVAGELARNGVRVVVIEAGTIGTGSHGRNLDSTPAGTPGFADFLAGAVAPLNGAAAPPPRLPGLAGIQGVGGMLVGWTHNSPTPDWWELPSWIDRRRWDDLIVRASILLHVGTEYSTEDERYKEFEDIVARRAGALPPGREVQPMPIAAEPLDGGGWRFSGADDLFRGANDNVHLVADHVVRSVEHRAGIAKGVLAYPVGGGRPVLINADAVVIAAGTVGSAQLITASRLDAGPALGAYLTEHTIVASRVHLKDDLRRHGTSTRFPPCVWIPASRAHQWSSTVHATQWNFNPAIPADAPFDDTIDLFSFCPVTPNEANRLEFDVGLEDSFGLPSASGALELCNDDFEVASDALRELFLLSSDLGDLVSGWGMQVPGRGGSFHLSGSCRMGAAESSTSVVSPAGRLWGYENCFVAGNAVLGERSASNPTLSTVAFALHTADSIYGDSTPPLIAKTKEPT